MPPFLTATDYLDEILRPPRGALGLSGAGRQPRFEAMPNEEADSALSRLGKNALGVLGYVGGSLEKALGGRAIRGLLGDKPREILSVIPFSDTLGITDPAERVSGVDLLKKAGLVQGEGTPGTIEGRDIAGLAVEALLDPATYLTLGTGAITKAGQAAKQLKILPQTAAGRIAGFKAGTPEAASLAAKMGVAESEVAGKALGGLAGFRLPFQNAPDELIFGAGPMGQAIAGKIGQASKWIGATRPALAAKAMFDPMVQSLTGGRAPITEAGQAAAREAQAAYRQAAPEVEKKIIEMQLARRAAGVEDEGRALRRAVEGKALPADAAGVQPFAAEARQMTDAMLQSEQDWGIPATELVSQYGTKYGPRQQELIPVPSLKSGSGKGGRMLPTGHPMLEMREAIFDVPGGTSMVDDMVMDQKLRAILDQAPPGNNLGAAKYIRDNYVGKDAQKQSEAIADWIKKSVDPQHAALQRPFFHADPITDLRTRALYSERAKAGAYATYGMLANAAQRGVGGPDMVPIQKALEGAGLTFTVTDNATGQVRGALSKMAEHLKVGVSDLGDFYVPADIAGDVARYGSAATSYAGVRPLLGVIDAVTDLTKTFQTAVWPAFHIRNFMSAVSMNYFTGAKDPTRMGVMAYVQPYIDAIAWRGGKQVAGANKIAGLQHLAEDAATQALATEIAAQGLTHGKGIFEDTATAAATTTRLPGDPAKGLLESAGETVAQQGWRAANPLMTRGVLANEDVFLPAAIGRKLGADTDDVTRVAHYIARRRQGFTPEAAALEVKKALYDYTDLTPFERGVMRRMIPFYGWMRNNLPFHVEQIITEPGGKVATAIKAGASLRQKEGGFVPPYLGEGLAIPLGEEKEGTQRYLSQLGLPFEDAFQPITPSGGLQRLLQRGLSNINPLLKGPLEYAAGTQFYSGRPLEELYGPTGYESLDQAIMSGPLSRFYTTGRTLGDERKNAATKALNLLTGTRLTDVDVDKQREIAGRQIIEEMLQGNRNIGHFETLSVKPGAEAMLSPEEIGLYRLYQNLQRRAQQRGKAKKGSIQMR